MTQPRKALGCRFRVQRGGGSAPGVPGAAAVGGDGKRKSGAARSRSRTLEELHACWGRRVDPSSVAGKRPRAAERATLSRRRWPELGGINRMPPGLELGDEGRRPLLIVAVSSHLRRPAGLADSANHPGQERQRDPKTDPGKGVGGKTQADKGRQRAAETPDGAGRGAETQETKRGRSDRPRGGGWSWAGAAGAAGAAGERLRQEQWLEVDVSR